MNIYKNLVFIYGILPYTSNLENKWGLILSILFGMKSWQVKISGNIIKFSSDNYSKLFYLLGLIEFAFSYSITKDGKLNVSLDGQNEFSASIINESYEEQNLIELLFKGAKKGANFTNNEKNYSLREKEIRIYQKDNKKIVETSEGIKFFLDSMHPANTIVETFLEKIHEINLTEKLDGKIVLDVGAECGDTALFYASLGATVYSFEPIKENFDAMKRNLSLNPELEKRVIPINIAVGKDGDLQFFKDANTPTYGASFVYNKRGKNVITENIQGLSLDSVLQKYKIEQVELMKMDCKGCEYHLTKSALSKIKKIKIEFAAFHVKKNISNVLNLLKEEGFSYVIYRNSETKNHSNKHLGTIYGKK